MMTDKSDGRVSAAQDATKKTPEELATWAVERRPDDSFRQWLKSKNPAFQR
jgi:hypothetical protein